MTNVAKVMTPDPKACAPEASLQEAAALMWENDCGCLPVVNGDGSLAGMITDRDICMAAFTQGKRLAEIPIAAAMSHEVVACDASEPVTLAEEKMQAHQLRRLPVTDHSGRLVGILSIGDLARAATQSHHAKAKHLPEVGETLAAVSAPRALHQPTVGV